MIVGVATFLFSGALATHEILGCFLAAGEYCHNWVYLARVHLFLAVLLALTSAGTFLRDRTWGPIPGRRHYTTGPIPTRCAAFQTAGVPTSSCPPRQHWQTATNAR